MAKAELPPAVCPHCGDVVDLTLVSGVDRNGKVRVYVNDVEWYLHLGVQHPDAARVPPLYRKKTGE